ncbi:MAG: GPW/gp25 family protein [Ilumatobacter sp.]|uniref:GPW/gp25 family protein n=1 Tax=Ilumatobacter sp. TaxID=1967498 RepID=UPI00260E8DE6|nr:GPW/gp25 family protein [Ilumatobacter sp.]MDJ0770652.1 GPW/gp25 family protein [Ilumatobacter sp.]
MSDTFVGRGWAFPMRIDASGGIAMVSDDREIEESIRLILGTALGERPMRPEFGCRIHQHVFGSADATTAGLIAYEVRASLRRWEPRIDVTDVDVGFDDDRPSIVYIDIAYRIRSTNDPRNLVFPFYSIPGEE